MYIRCVFNIYYTASWGLSVIVLSGTEVAATSKPNKTMTLNPQLAVHSMFCNISYVWLTGDLLTNWLSYPNSRDAIASKNN